MYVRTSSVKPNSAAMADRLGDMRHWSENSSTTTVVNRTSVKFFELRSVHNTDTHSSRTAAAARAANSQHNSSTTAEAQEQREPSTKHPSFDEQVEQSRDFFDATIYGGCSGSTSSTTLGTGIRRLLLRLGQGRPLGMPERAKSGKTALIASSVSAFACCAPRPSCLTCAASPGTKLVHPTTTRPASPAAGTAFRSPRSPEERRSLQRMP